MTTTGSRRDIPMAPPPHQHTVLLKAQPELQGGEEVVLVLTSRDVELCTHSPVLFCRLPLGFTRLSVKSSLERVKLCYNLQDVNGNKLKGRA